MKLIAALFGTLFSLSSVALAEGPEEKTPLNWTIYVVCRVMVIPAVIYVVMRRFKSTRSSALWVSVVLFCLLVYSMLKDFKVITLPGI
jgi:hypothetical protein